jgi:hypothetical protein
MVSRPRDRILTPGKDWTIFSQDAGRGATEPLRSRYIVLRIRYIMLNTAHIPSAVAPAFPLSLSGNHGTILRR